MTEEKVTYLAPRTEDNRVVTPKILLQREHTAAEAGERDAYDSALVLYWDSDNELIHYATSNLSLLEILGLLEAGKAAIPADEE